MPKDCCKQRVDFLGQPLVVEKCKLCKKEYYRMRIDSETKLCPTCDNGKEPDEVNI